MFSSGQMDTIMRKALSQLGIEDQPCDNDKQKEKHKDDKTKDNKINLTPAQILVVSGILGGALSVDSFLVDKDQQIQILLTGSLKRKTELEKVMDEIGKKPFDQVLKAMLGRL